MSDETKVSVIIPERDDRTYLVRCLNSIRRQTFKNIEVFLLGNDYSSDLCEEYGVTVIPTDENDDARAFNECLKNITGQYLYIQDMDSVNAPNLFQALLEKEENKSEGDTQTFYSAYCVYSSGDRYLDIARPRLYFEGKLFSVNEIRRRNLSFTAFSLLSPNVFAMEYLKEFSNIEVVESAYVYRNAALETDIREVPDVMKIRFVGQLYRSLKDDKDFVYRNINTHIKPYYMRCLKSADEQIYEATKEFLGFIAEDSLFLTVILSLLEITDEQYNFMIEHNLSDYSFYKDKLIKESIGDKQIVKQIELLEKTIKTLEGTSEMQKNAIVNYEKSINIITDDYYKLKLNIEEMSARINDVSSNIMKEPELVGLELADSTVENFRRGKLGLKTLLRSLGAWFKYKWRRKK